MTKFEQIKEMGMKELADMLKVFDGTEFCNEEFCPYYTEDGCKAHCDEGCCAIATENYLKSEV